MKRIIFFVLGAVVLFLAAAIVLSPARNFVANYGPMLADRVGETRSSAPPPQVTDLTNLGQLQADFNAADGQPRLVMLLSPT